MCIVSGVHDGSPPGATMDIARALPGYCSQVYVTTWGLSFFACHNQRSPFCIHPIDTVCNLTLDATHPARHPPVERSRMITVLEQPKTGEDRESPEKLSQGGKYERGGWGRRRSEPRQ